MKILYIGSGYVGTCSAAVMADSGHDVLVYDIDERKIKMLASNNVEEIESCLLEDGLCKMLANNKDRITFTADYNDVVKALNDIDAVFMCLPTPEKEGSEGESDLSYYYKAANELASHLAKRNKGEQSKYIVIVNKSTVPVNMINMTAQIMNEHGVINFGVVSNPEFLVEGKAIEGSIRPDRVIIGAEKEQDFKIMREVYARFSSTNVKYIETNPYEAAAGKLLANYLLFSKLAVTFDVIGRLCEFFPNIKFENVRQIINTDARIGTWGLYDSVYAGGSCFIKDAASLAHQMEEAGANTHQIRLSLEANKFQRDHFYSRAEKEAGFSWDGKVITVLGVAFKQNTNDVRHSPAIDIVRHLINSNVSKIRIYDPAALPMFKNLFNPKNDPRYEKIEYFDTEEEALKGSNACLILTDWAQFRLLGEKIQSICPPPYLIMDGRRLVQDKYEELQSKGYDVIAVGSSFLKSKI
ncbi:MAG: UDPglucose 6-dehydrogenase [Parcubacteria group bacterium Gr01-1014_13]|nr:MAG: UDPglucose 6-dehydrogenase [Parcubacteria group bacterium Gr01-1014_13]